MRLSERMIKNAVSVGKFDDPVPLRLVEVKSWQAHDVWGLTLQLIIGQTNRCLVFLLFFLLLDLSQYL
jgi:hypothetical protein